jgi:hypothetical protein
MAIANHLEILYRTADHPIAIPENETLVNLRVGILEISENEIRETGNGVAWALIPATEPPWIISDRIPIILLLRSLILLMVFTQVHHLSDILQPRIRCPARQAKICPMDPHLMTPPTEPE